MRNWKNWLFPILTALTVTALALLPLRLSTLEDGKLTGTVHAEDLSEDSNFPFKPCRGGSGSWSSGRKCRKTSPS